MIPAAHDSLSTWKQPDRTTLHPLAVSFFFLQGTPVFSLLTKNNCTVTLCHSRTVNLPEIVKAADILVVAIGSAEFVKGDWIKEGAVVIDVGTNAVEGNLSL